MAAIDGSGIGVRAPRGAANRFTSTFARVQREAETRGPQRLDRAVPRLDARLEFDRRVRRLDEASRSLQAVTPEAEYRVSSRTERGPTQETTSVENVVTETEVVTAATAARQVSSAFKSADAIVADKKSKLELDLPDGELLKVNVGGGGASLNDLAAAINADPLNGGQLQASVISDAEGFRLQIEATTAGTAGDFGVHKDDFQAPAGGSFALLDPALEVAAQDETRETIKTSEEVTTTERTVETREVETRERVDDEEFAARVEEFSEAFNALRRFLDRHDAEEEASGEDPLLADQEDVVALQGALEELSGGLGARESDAGRSLSDVGLAVDGSGELSFDAEQLQAALESDATSVVELLNADGALGGDVLEALSIEQAGPDLSAASTEVGRSVASFLDRVELRGEALEIRSELLGHVHATLGGAESVEALLNPR